MCKHNYCKWRILPWWFHKTYRKDPEECTEVWSIYLSQVKHSGSGSSISALSKVLVKVAPSHFTPRRAKYICVIQSFLMGIHPLKFLRGYQGRVWCCGRTEICLGGFPARFSTLESVLLGPWLTAEMFIGIFMFLDWSWMQVLISNVLWLLLCVTLTGIPPNNEFLNWFLV